MCIYYLEGFSSTEAAESTQAEPPRLSSGSVPIDGDAAAEMFAADAFAVEEGHGFWFWIWIGWRIWSRLMRGLSWEVRMVRLSAEGKGGVS